MLLIIVCFIRFVLVFFIVVIILFYSYLSIYLLKVTKGRSH